MKIDQKQELGSSSQFSVYTGLAAIPLLIKVSL